jgi:hypothetical protein
VGHFRADKTAGQNQWSKVEEESSAGVAKAPVPHFAPTPATRQSRAQFRASPPPAALLAVISAINYRVPFDIENRAEVHTMFGGRLTSCCYKRGIDIAEGLTGQGNGTKRTL